MSKTGLPKSSHARVALCYIRQSYTRDDNDTNSPERQRENIKAFCEAKGWLPEWYEDTGGHKSGRSETNRPQWMALKQRFADPDVVALVANDLSRLHRKGWRVGDLIETLNKHDVALALAAPGRQQIDTSTQQGKMLVQLGAMFDEYYAEDIAQRAKDSVAYRKARSITIGVPPFGTRRNAEGRLERTEEGAWLLPEGKFQAGIAGENLPVEGAIWRGYADAALEILKLYATGTQGLERIAYSMNEAG
jgi:DNA invertase Pin-like site-specific DNA recombinase